MTLTVFPKRYEPITKSALSFKKAIRTETNADFRFPEVGFYAPPIASYYGNYAQLSFDVLPEFSSSYVLLKGLIEFNRSRHLRFDFNATKRNFRIELELTRMPELLTLLQRVHDQLLAELRFKAALRKTIEFEQRYKQACVEVYRDLKQA